jgi:hypothetical protein
MKAYVLNSMAELDDFELVSLKFACRWACF